MRKYFTVKRIIAAVVVLGVIGGGVAYKSRNGKTQNVLTETVKKQSLKQTVLATGQVTSTTDLSLNFKGVGIVRQVNVAVGAQVKAGAILAALDQKDQAASMTQARGSLAQARANYQRVIDGASSEEVTIAQRGVDSAQTRINNAKTALQNTKQQQDTLVKNAYKALLNSGFEAVPTAGNLNNVSLKISGSYNGTETGTYTIIQEGRSFYVQGLETRGNQDFNTSVPLPLPLGTRGLYVEFPSTIAVATDRWTVEVPNTRAPAYITNLNNYNAALESQRSALSNAEAEVNNAQTAYEQAVAQLDAKKAQARPAEVAAARAQILSAEGQVQAASAALENTIIRAPSNGTITVVNAKVGQQASTTTAAIVLQDVGSLHVEANISEANIAAVAVGQEVSFTFDALGPDRVYKGTVQTIDPASTVVSGVVNYKVTARIDKVEEVKPGMTANMSILTASVDNVLAISQRAVITKNGKKLVRVVNDPVKKTYQEAEITTGLQADQGLIEIKTGLSEGQEIVTFVKE